MAVYVDPMMVCIPNKNWKWNTACHLFADKEDELHTFAKELDLKRSWFQHKPGKLPHYDLTENKRKQALKLGAVDDIGFENLIGLVRIYRFRFNARRKRDG